MLITQPTTIEGQLVTPSESVACPDCGDVMLLRKSKFGLFYGCQNYPGCRNTHGAHPDGRPLGFPVDKETRQLRRRVHELCELMWDWNDRRERSHMYAWLKKNTSTGHIGQLDKDELRVLEYDILELLSVKPV